MKAPLAQVFIPAPHTKPPRGPTGKRFGRRAAYRQSPAKAKSIVEYRQKNGAFKSVEELKNVKGIGDAVLN